MKKLITAAIAASALAVAVPAMAQTYLDNRASELEQRIDAGAIDGSLTSGEASVLRAGLRDAERLQDRYEAEGMAGWQQRALERRYNDVSDQIASMKSNTEYRYRRWDEDVW